jgi:hypothetical protein
MPNLHPPKSNLSKARVLPTAMYLATAITGGACGGAGEVTEPIATEVAALTTDQLPTYGGGPVLQPEIVTLYWGTMASADINTMNTYLAGLVNYMNGATAPVGQEPVLYQYGVYGASLGATVDDTVLPASGHARYGDVKARIQSWQSLGYLPPFTPNRLFLVFTQGIILDDLFGEADHTALGQNVYVARVPFEKKLSGKTLTVSHQKFASHEIFEAATDPSPTSGWAARSLTEGEIGDVCVSNTATTTFGTLQAVADKLGGGCAIYSRQRLSQTVAVSWGPRRIDLVSRGADQGIVHKSWTPAGWSPSFTGWESIGGASTAAPAAVSWGAGRLDVFVRGTDGAVYHKALVDSTWYPSQLDWNTLGGSIIGSPAVVSWSSDRIDIFVQGLDASYYHKAWDGSQWLPSETGWEPMGGNFIGPPNTSSNMEGKLVVFGEGFDGQYYEKFWNGSSWYPSTLGWASLGGRFISTPVSVSWGPTGSDLFGIADDGSLRHLPSNGTSFTSWENLGGSLVGPPAVVSWGQNRIDVFAQGTDFSYYHKAFDGAWRPSQTDYEYHGGGFLSAPAVSLWANHLDIFGTDLFNGIDIQDYDSASGYSPGQDSWAYLGGALH